MGIFIRQSILAAICASKDMVIYVHAQFEKMYLLLISSHHFYSLRKSRLLYIISSLYALDPKNFLGDIALFLGHHITQLRNSNHLFLPSTWKKLISEGAYLTQGFDQNIMILTPDVFQEIYARMSALNIADPLARLLLRMFLGTANYVETTEHDSFTLPSNLLKYANLNSEVVIVGQGEYIEVWSSDLWQQQELEIQNTQANSQRFSSFAITTA